jgi:hypothetical protein
MFFNHLNPNGTHMYHLLYKSIIVFESCMILTINSDYFLKQH